MNSDKLNIANKIIGKQTELINLFDEWVRLIKAEEMVSAAESVKKANILRLEITQLKKTYKTLNKKSGIILLKDGQN